MTAAELIDVLKVMPQGVQVCVLPHKASQEIAEQDLLKTTGVRCARDGRIIVIALGNESG